MKKQTIIQALGLGSAVIALGACTSLPVRTDINPNMSASSCHTYAFADEHVANTDQASAFGNPINADRLRVAIEYNMAARGIQKTTDRRAAECVVGFAMGTRQVFDDYYGNFGVGLGWGGGWGGGWGRRGGFGGYGGFGYDGPFVRDETRISVDLFDNRSHIPIWHASVSQSVADLSGPNAVDKINRATTAIFTKFPNVGTMPPPGPHTAT